MDSGSYREEMLNTLVARRGKVEQEKQSAALGKCLPDSYCMEDCKPDKKIVNCGTQ